MGRKNKNISTLILVSTSAAVPFLQSTGTVKVDSFFSLIKDFIFGLFSGSGKDTPKKEAPSYSLRVPPMEDCVRTIYDGGEVDKLAKVFFKREIDSGDEVNVDEEFEKLSEEKKIKYRVQGVIQANYELLISQANRICLVKEKEITEGLIKEWAEEKDRIQKSVNALSNKKNQLEVMLNNKLDVTEKSLNKGIKTQKNSLSNKLKTTDNVVLTVEQSNVKGPVSQLSEDKAKSNLPVNEEKSLDEIKKEIASIEKSLSALKKGLSDIDKKLVVANGRVKEISEYLDSLKMEVLPENKNLDNPKKVVSANPQFLKKCEDVLYRAFDISKAEGNNRAILSAEDYFKEIVGFSEGYFRNNPEKIKQCFQKDKDGNVVVRNLLNGREFCAGKFEQLSLGKVKNSRSKNGEKSGKISVIGINKRFSEASRNLQKMVDVSTLQAKKENRKALFVVASNYNALETFDAKDSVNKKKVIDYFYDPTQGPSSTLSAAEATLVRHLEIYQDKYPDDVLKWRQTDEGERQVNLLEDLEIKTKNGYIFDDIKKILAATEKLEKNVAEEEEKLEDKFKIGYHSNVQVCSDNINFYRRTASFFYDKDQKIDQAFVAAVSLTEWDIESVMFESLSKEEKEHLGELEKGDKEKYDEEYKKKFEYCEEILERFAKQVAKLNFKTVLRVAVDRGIKKVYFPLLGCGAFGNKYSWVIDAIKEDKDFIENNGLEVILNIAGDGVSKNNDGLYAAAAALTKSGNGDFKIYDEDENGKIVEVGKDIFVKSPVKNSVQEVKNKGFFDSFFDHIFV